MIRLMGVMLTLTLGATAIGLWLYAGSSGAAEAAVSIPDGSPATGAPYYSTVPAPISPPDDVTPTPPGPTPKFPVLIPLGEPVCGGTYEGEFVGGGTIRIVVADDCETVASVEIAGLAEDCGALPAELPFDPPLAIENSTFFGETTTNSSLTVSLLGAFQEDGPIHGVIDVTDFDNDCQVHESYVAELVVGLPTTGGSSIAADGGAGPGVWALIAALVATGATGLAVFGWRHARIQ